MADDLLVLVEGRDDKHVILAIVAHHHFEPKFTIRDEEGLENLLLRMPGILALRNFQRLGIVVDADLNLASRWGSLRRIIEGAGYTTMSELPHPDGTIVDDSYLPRVGVWIMPDNQLPGMIEDYVALLVPEGDSLWSQANKCVDEIPVEDRRFTHPSKALIHTWLAWQEDPGTPLGQAITKRYLNPESPHVSRFLDWLARLFA